MEYAIFSVEKQKIGRIDPTVKDDVISRQSIFVRDANALGLDEDTRYVIIEGNPEALKRAEELFSDFAKQLKGEDGQKIYQAFKVTEEDASSGMGMIFG
jgi:hypothetical protein